MSIMDKIEPTEALKLEKAESVIRKVNANLFNQIKDKHTYIFNLIWNNSDGLSAQAVLDRFGAEAFELFVFSQSIQTLLYQIDNSYTPLTPPNDYVINKDGTVTVGEIKAPPVVDIPTGELWLDSGEVPPQEMI